MAANAPAARAAKPAGQDVTDASELASDILRKTTSLLISGPRPHAAEQLDLYDGIFARLMPQVAAERLAEFSTALAGLERAPYATARQLAAHGDIRVAAPMLAKAAVLTERDLTDIIKTAGQSHLIAIAIRKQLAEPLSDLLIGRSVPAVRMALVKNLTARFSEDTYRSLFKSAERDDELAEKLGSRTDLPAKLSRAFVAVASETARARFIKAAPLAAQATLQATPTRSASAGMRASWDYSHIKAEVAALNRSGKLRDAAVNRFVHSGDFPAAIFSLAVLSDVAVEVIEALMDDDRRAELLVACKASRLSWATASMILRGRPGCAPVPPDELDEERIRFEKLVLSEAQWKIRFGIKAN
ncbi:MAG: DUF2336 domain-containing protein [Bradyrhizobium sp.]|uniref:DUF2336 domain-containing protein n=1 Tax=Bradyrhizobium sp. TaxID=376 RepID=UPI003C7DE64D